MIRAKKTARKMVAWAYTKRKADLLELFAAHRRVEKCDHKAATPNGFDFDEYSRLIQKWELEGGSPYTLLKARWPVGHHCPACGLRGVFYANAMHSIVADG